MGWGSKRPCSMLLRLTCTRQLHTSVLHGKHCFANRDTTTTAHQCLSADDEPNYNQELRAEARPRVVPAFLRPDSSKCMFQVIASNGSVLLRNELASGQRSVLRSARDENELAAFAAPACAPMARQHGLGSRPYPGFRRRHITATGELCRICNAWYTRSLHQSSHRSRDLSLQNQALISWKQYDCIANRSRKSTKVMFEREFQLKHL